MHLLSHQWIKCIISVVHNHCMTILMLVAWIRLSITSLWKYLSKPNVTYLKCHYCRCPKWSLFHKSQASLHNFKNLNNKEREFSKQWNSGWYAAIIPLCATHEETSKFFSLVKKAWKAFSGKQMSSESFFVCWFSQKTQIFWVYVIA